jgi:hypothetical protein
LRSDALTAFEERGEGVKFSILRVRSHPTQLETPTRRDGSQNISAAKALATWIHLLHFPNIDCAIWLHKARQMSTEQFRREVEKELTGRETEAWEIIYFKLYKSQIPVIEQALETAALMLGSDKSRGYCLEMICADFLAGANVDGENPRALADGISRLFKFLPETQRQALLHDVVEKVS